MTASRKRRPNLDWQDQEAGHVARFLEVLQGKWGHATCELDHVDGYQLLVATILSAQSTDKLINLTTPALFARYPDATALAEAETAELEELVHATGFFRVKARNLIAMAKQVVAEHDGEIPRTMAAMVELPGVARKTANMVLGVAYGVAAGIVVDTHVQRVAGRIGLSDETKPEKIEQDLMKLIPKERWIDFGQQLIWHGRRICHARKPACDDCPLERFCRDAEPSPPKSTAKP